MCTLFQAVTYPKHICCSKTETAPSPEGRCIEEMLSEYLLYYGQYDGEYHLCTYKPISPEKRSMSLPSVTISKSFSEIKFMIGSNVLPLPITKIFLFY